MALVCEDLAKYGVILIPPTKAEYFDLVAGIERRLQSRPNGAPPLAENALSHVSEHDRKSAVLLNRAPVAVASLAYIWYFPGRNGSTIPHRSMPGTNSSVLLPFGLGPDERMKKVNAYWNTIFPGSQRLLMADGTTLGDNSDVRLPSADELWHGGFVMGSGSDLAPEEPLRLKLDGVFFVDGGFAGPNELGAWEQTVFAAEANLACAAIAKDASRTSLSPEKLFLQLEQVTGRSEGRSRPTVLGFGPLDPEAIRKQERLKVGRQVLGLRQTLGDEAAATAIAKWADAPVPKFHRVAA